MYQVNGKIKECMSRRGALSLEIQASSSRSAKITKTGLGKTDFALNLSRKSTIMLGSDSFKAQFKKDANNSGILDDGNHSINEENYEIEQVDTKDHGFPLDASETNKVTSTEKDCEQSKGVKSIEVFQRMYKQTLSQNLTKADIDFCFGYEPSMEDEQKGIFHFNINNRPHDAYNFQVYHKNLIIVNTSRGQIPIVTTIERLMNKETNTALKVIKTLRIYDEKTLKERQKILLEEIDMTQYKVHHECFKRPIFVQRNDFIYFFRKCSLVYKLFKFDIVKGSLKEYSEYKSRYHYRMIDHLEIKRGVYLRFASEFGNQDQINKDKENQFEKNKTKEISLATNGPYIDRQKTQLVNPNMINSIVHIEKEDQKSEREFIESQFILVQTHFSNQDDERYIKVFSMQNTQRHIFKKDVKDSDALKDMIVQFMFIKQNTEKLAPINLKEGGSPFYGGRESAKHISEAHHFDSDQIQEMQQMRLDGQVVLTDFTFTFVMLVNNKIFHLIYKPSEEHCSHASLQWIESRVTDSFFDDVLTVQHAEIKDMDQINKKFTQYYILDVGGSQNFITPIYPFNFMEKPENLEDEKALNKWSQQTAQEENRIVELIAQAKDLDPTYRDASRNKIIKIVNKKGQGEVIGKINNLQEILESRINPTRPFNEFILTSHNLNQRLYLLKTGDNSGIEVFTFNCMQQQIMKQVEFQSDLGQRESNLNDVDSNKNLLSTIQLNILDIIYEHRKYRSQLQVYYLNSIYANVIQGTSYRCNQGHIHGTTFVRYCNKHGQTDTYELPKNEQSRFTIYEQENGLYKKLQLLDEDTKDLYFRNYYKTKTHVLFVFNYSAKKDLENVERVAQIFFVTTIEQLESNEEQVLIDPNKKVLNWMIGPDQMKTMNYDEVQKYVQETKLKDFKNIKLSFERHYDFSTRVDFAPFYYQEEIEVQGKVKSYHPYILLMNVETLEIIEKYAVNSEYESMIASDVQNQLLTRTSNIKYDEKVGVTIVKYQLFQSFNKMGASFSQATEYLIYQTKKKAEIRVCGQKQFFETIKCHNDPIFQNQVGTIQVPFYDMKHNIKGCQLVKTYCPSSKEFHVKIIGLYDQDQNNLFTLKTNCIQFGYQKFYNNKDDMDCFTLVIAAQMRRHELVRENARFNNNEIMSIMYRTLQKCRSMKPMNFQYVMCNSSFDEQKDKLFFSGREFFNGKSICDICLNDPVAILEALNKGKNHVKANDGCLMDQILDGQNDDIIRNIKNFKLRENAKVISTDFNFTTQIYRGIKMECVSAVKILLTHLFSTFNSNEYSYYVMLELPTIMNIDDDISSIYGYFHRTNQELEEDAEEFCAIENNLNHDALPVISHTKYESIYVNEFENFSHPKSEYVAKILDREANRGTKNFRSMDISIEHKYIDFQPLIIGEKIRDPFSKYQLDDYKLTKLLYQEDLNFYKQEFVRKLIDIQFPWTRIFYISLLWFYILFFFVPLLLTVIRKNQRDHITYILQSMQIFSQVIFISIEINQIINLGCEYFKDLFNIFELTQFCLFMSFVTVKFTEDFPADSILQISILLVLVVQSFMKVMFFVRVFEQYGFLVTMVGITINDAVPFMIFFFMFVLFFSTVVMILELNIDPLNKSYPEMLEGLRIVIQTYRNSIGDISTPNYNKWIELVNENYITEQQLTYLMTIIWFFWIMNQMITLIILLNFLIAVISDSYANVNAVKDMYTYSHKAELNYECYQIFDRFGIMKTFKVMIISCELKDEDDQIDEIQRLGHQIMVHTDESIQALEERVNQKLLTNNEQIKNINEQVTEIKAQMANVNSNLEKLCRQVLTTDDVSFLI